MNNVISLVDRRQEKEYKKLSVDQKINKFIENIMSTPLFPGEPTTNEIYQKPDKTWYYKGPNSWGTWRCMGCGKEMEKDETGYFTKSLNYHLLQCKDCVSPEWFIEKEKLEKPIETKLKTFWSKLLCQN
jgi:hypothetical protein